MQSIYRTTRTALHAMRRNVMRSALTCLGIVIGIASVIAMAEIGQGASYQFAQAVASMGVNQIMIEPGDTQVGGISSGANTRVTLTPQDAEAITRECAAVKWVAPSVDSSSQLVYGNKNWNAGNVKGSTPAYLRVRNWQIASGEAFTDEDVERGAPVCLIGSVVARELFGHESPLGKEIRLKNLGLRVVGVLKAKGANMMGRDQDDFLLAPWTTLKFRLSGSKTAFQTGAASGSSASGNTLKNLYPAQQPALYPPVSAAQAMNMPKLIRFADLDDIYVSANSTAEIPQAIKQITGVLRDRHNLPPDAPDDFEIRNSVEFAQVLGSTTTLVSKLLLCVALISLIVGGVGIMNIMLVSVTERTREIGLRMAVGAKGRDILGQFLTEAFLLCLAGGVVGIALGRVTSLAITRFLRWPTMLSPSAILAAVIVSGTVGVVFGYYPAWKASRLDPIEALRFE